MTTWNLFRRSFSLKVLVQSSKKTKAKEKRNHYSRIQAGFNSAWQKKAKHWTQNQFTDRCTILSEKYKPLLKCSKRFIPPQTDRMICFYSNIGCFESKVIFKWRKNNNDKNKQKKAFTRSKHWHLVYFIQSQSDLSQNETNKRRR